MLQLLRQIIKKINSADNLTVALEFFVKKITGVFSADSCLIFLTNQRPLSEFTMAKIAYNNKNFLLNKPCANLNKGLIGIITKTKEPLCIDDVASDKRFDEDADNFQKNYRSFLGVPILYRSQFLGVLILQNQQPRNYDEAEEAFLTTISLHIGKLIIKTQEKEPQTAAKRQTDVIRIQAKAAVSGIAIGTAVVLCSPTNLSDIPDKQIVDIDDEINKFTAALKAVYDETKFFAKRLESNLPKEELALFDAHLKIIESKSLTDAVIKQINTGNWAQAAVRDAFGKYLINFKQMENEYFCERAADIQDIALRIIANLQSTEKQQLQWPQKTILIAQEITTTNLAEIPQDKLAGIISLKGGINSHAVVLARALAVPTLIDPQNLSFANLDGEKIIIDGYYGQAFICPNQRLTQAFQRLAQEETDLDISLEPLRNLATQTLDDHQISLYVNTGLTSDIGKSLAIGAAGVGLYRTEIPFINSERLPSGEEQRIMYRQLLSAFVPRPVTMRALDIGGDKCLPYLPIKEDNPFLGCRGIRFLLDNNEIFISQMRAMLKANIDNNNLQIMLPMVTDIAEVIEAVNIIKEIYFELQSQGCNIVMPKIGVMIEVPAATYQTYNIAQLVDFIAVGTNDLTQYLLAVDRNNQQVAFLYDSLHPAMLHLLRFIVKSARKANKPVGICGELASDPVATALLLALGFDYVSVSAAMLLRIKWVIRSFTLARAKTLLHQALRLKNAQQIRTLLENELILLGLDGLLRIGKK